MQRTAWLLLALLTVAGCSQDAPDGVLRVSAAASLTDAFQELTAAFEETQDGVTVQLNLAGSTTLVEQAVQGAPIDVLATADERTMARAAEAGAVGTPTPFATNSLVVAHPADGPTRTVADLADPELLVGLCAPEVPCGAAARDALALAEVSPRPDTEDSDVRTLLARIARRELDVGVVYATDLVAAPEVVGTALPGGTTRLVAAVVPEAPPAADAFVAFLGSATGQRILSEHGFGPPGGPA